MPDLNTKQKSEQRGCFEGQREKKKGRSFERKTYRIYTKNIDRYIKEKDIDNIYRKYIDIYRQQPNIFTNDWQKATEAGLEGENVRERLWYRDTFDMWLNAIDHDFE